MSTINLATLYPDASPGFLYKDISLDIKSEINVLPRGLFREDNITDIASSKDEGAIMNSLRNIFNTVPGQKLLNPEFGLDLRRYLFQPLTTDIAQNIGDTILIGLKLYEPRVIVNSVDIFTDFDENQYTITLYISIPTLNISEAQYRGVLNTEGFVFNTNE
jgi:phage baseplate assembly protein W